MTILIFLKVIFLCLVGIGITGIACIPIFWLVSNLFGWQFICQPVKSTAIFFVPRFGFGYFYTGWFTPRKYGDGLPDPKRKGNFLPPTKQTRTRQLGWELIFLKYGFTVILAKEESR